MPWAVPAAPRASRAATWFGRTRPPAATMGGRLSAGTASSMEDTKLRSGGAYDAPWPPDSIPMVEILT